MLLKHISREATIENFIVTKDLFAVRVNTGGMDTAETLSLLKEAVLCYKHFLLMRSLEKEGAA